MCDFLKTSSKYSLVFAVSLLLSVYAFAESTAAPAVSPSVADGPKQDAPASNALPEGKRKEEVNALLRTLEANMFPSVARASMRMISFKDGKEVKTIDMNFKNKNSNVLIDIQAPAVDKGKYILKANADLWMYFSKIKRSLRIASRDSFMGTDASNYDLLELNLIDDYEVRGVEDVNLNGKTVSKLDLYAKPKTQGYDHIVSWIDTENRRIIKNDCYAISGTLIKTINYESYLKVDNYFVPEKINIENHLEAGRNSVIEISNVEALKSLDDSTFSLGYLESLN